MVFWDVTPCSFVGTRRILKEERVASICRVEASMVQLLLASPEFGLLSPSVDLNGHFLAPFCIT